MTNIKPTLFAEPERNCPVPHPDPSEPLLFEAVSEYPLPLIGPAHREEVYRLFDVNGILLYVGRSVQSGARLEQHSKTKSWWPLVAKVTIQRDFPLGSYELEEYNAILTEFPVFNVDGVPWRKIRLSDRPVEMDQLRNRVTIANAVRCLDDDGVAGRLEVLRATEPDVYDEVDDDPDVMRFRWAPGDWNRTMLIKAEERYFNAFAELHRGPYPLHLRRQRVIVDEHDNIIRVEPARLPPSAEVKG